MSRLREAAQQALDYWESASFGDAVMVDKMDALRAALAEPVQEPNVPETNFWHMVPVGWLENPFGSFRRNWLWKLDPPPKTLAWSIPLYAAPSQPAEPVQSTAWAHLPNAVHIDRILAHAKEHPRKWTAAWAAAWDADGRVFRDDALSLSWAVALRTYRDKAWNAAMDADSGATRDAIVALIAWDDAGELLSLPIDAVKAKADEGNHAAILIYPAMLAMREDK